MRLFHLVILALLCGTVSQGHAQDPRARASLVTNSKEQFVSRGLNHPRSDVDIGQVEGIIDAPVGHVIQLLRDYSNYRHFLPFFTGSKVIVRDDRGVLVRMKAKILKGAVTIDAVVRASEKAVGYGGTRFELHKVKGNIELLDAVWTVYPIAGDRTLVIFRMMLDPDIWFVRDSTLSNYNQVNSRRTIRAIRDRVKKIPYQPPRPQAVAPEQVPPTPQMPPAAPGPASP